MERLRKLGKTGIKVGPLGLGGASLGRREQAGKIIYDDDLAVQTVLTALQNGINLIDTSPNYGESERRIGLALAAWEQEGGRREDIILCTKTGGHRQPHSFILIF